MSDLFRLYPGWLGAHTRGEAPGAFPNGTRIKKTVFEKGDGHPLGTLGTVLGSIAAPSDLAARFGTRYFYFVEWDPKPKVAVGVAGSKISAETSGGTNG